MQNSQYITRNKKGMAISIDALLALIIFIAMSAFILTEPTSNLTFTQPMLASNQLIDDAIAAMDSTGFIMESIENGQFENMETKLEAMLPAGMDYNIKITRYEAPLDIPENKCRNPLLGQDFETCFPYDVNIYSIGSIRPTNKDIYHGQKIFIKKESGSCEIVNGELKEKKWINAMFTGDNTPEAKDVNITTSDSCPGTRNPCPTIEDAEMRCCYDYYDADSDPQDGVAYKWYKYDEETSLWEPTAETGPIHSFDEDNDTNRFKCSVTVSDGPNPEDWGTDTNSPFAIIGGPCFLFESNVTVNGTGLPVTDYVCGETYNVNFEVSAEAGERQDPVDIMLSLDRSGSMSWMGRYDASGTERDITYDNVSGKTFVSTADYVYKLDIDQESGGITYNTVTANGVVYNPYGMVVDGDYVFVADDDEGLVILNKNDMSKTVTVGATGSEKEITAVRDVFVSGDYAYLAAAGTYTPGTEKTYDEQMTGSRNDNERIGYNSSQSWAAQSFQPDSQDINGIEFEVRRYRNPGNLTVHIRSTLTGADLTNGTAEIAAGDISTSWGTWEIVNFNPAISVTPGETYYIVLTTTSESTSNYYKWGSRLSSSNPYSNGALYICTSGGSCTERFDEGSGWDSDKYEDTRFRTFAYSSLVGGLVIVDKSDADPNNWTVLSNLYDTGSGLIDQPQSVFVSENYAYLTDQSGDGLWIIDILNKANPTMEGFVSTTNPQSVVVSGNYAYVADEDAGLRIIDVSNETIVTTMYGSETVKDVAIYDSNLYIIANTGSGATADGLHVLDISNPASPVEIITFDSPYEFYKIFVGENYIYATMNMGTTTMDRIFGSKINFARNSATEFVNFEDWEDPEDKLGTSSYGYNSDSSLDYALSDATEANKAAISAAIGGLMARNGTPMDQGLDEAIDELTESNGRADAMQFIILLADGQSDSGTQGAIDTQVARARSNEIYIFTIGFGGDVDETQLENIATGAYCPDEAEGDCGSYHHISDPGALSNVYQLIAVRIAELSGRMPDGSTTDIELKFGQFGNGITVENISEGGVWDADNNTLDFKALDIRFGWEGSFDTTIACNYVGCGKDFVAGNMASFPPTDTQIYYELDGIGQNPIYWPNKFEVETVLYYNDLVIEFIEGLFYSISDTKVKYEVLNEGYQTVDLGEINPTVNFYNEETSETACNGADIGTESFTDILDAAYGTSSGINTSVEGETNLSGSGYICLWVNKPPQTNVIECEENNQILINCDIPETYIYVVDYWTWEK